MKRTTFFLIILVWSGTAAAQTVTLDQCLEKANTRYPLVKQYGLLEKTTAFNLANASRFFLPQVTLSAKASYQSDVTKIPDQLGDILSNITHQPVSFESLSRDQYQAVIDVQQLVWDGGATSARKQAIKAGAEMDKQKLAVDLYGLNDRIQQLYFGLMLIEEQRVQNQLLTDELNRNLKRVQTGIDNGVAQPADADAVKVELIRSAQREDELNTVRKTYRQMLSAFTGLEIGESTTLVKPVRPEISENSVNNRPELNLFEAQKQAMDAQESGIRSANLPKIGVYAQGGYANPALNMFDPGFNPFYIAGVRVSWSLSELYSRKDNLSKTELSRKSIDVQKETFLFNQELARKQQVNEIDRLESVMKTDDELIALRRNIKKAAEARFENGTITVNDLLREITAENLAVQAKTLHEIQQHLALYQLKHLLNH